MGHSDDGASEETLEECLRAEFQTQIAHRPTPDGLINRVLGQTKAPPIDVRSPFRARRLLPPLAVSLTLFVATAAIVVTVRHLSDAGPTAASAVSARAPAATAPPTTRDPAAVTATELAHLLKAAPVLPGARESKAAPLPALRQQTNGPAQPEVVVRSRWWTAPGTVEAALSYFDAQRQAGLTRTETDGPVTDHGVISQGLAFSAPDAVAYTQARLALTVIAVDGGVAVRAEASAVWLPARTAAEHIPASATSVDVVLTRGAAITRRSLSGIAVQRIADPLNRLTVYPPGTYSCPMSRGNSDILTFHSTDAAEIVATIAVDGCQGVSVTVNGVPQAALWSLGTKLEATLLFEFGLPASFDSLNR